MFSIAFEFPVMRTTCSPFKGILPTTDGDCKSCIYIHLGQDSNTRFINSKLRCFGQSFINILSIEFFSFEFFLCIDILSYFFSIFTVKIEKKTQLIELLVGIVKNTNISYSAWHVVNIHNIGANILDNDFHGWN